MTKNLLQHRLYDDRDVGYIHAGYKHTGTETILLYPGKQINF